MFKKIFILSLAFLGCMAIAGAARAEVITIDTDTTWSGEIAVGSDGVVVSDGATLTIKADAVVKMGTGASIIVNNANLILAGEAGKPAIITSAAADPSPGDWGHIMTAGTSTLSMNYAKIEYGGGGGLSIPAYLFIQQSGPVSIENSDLLNNNGSILVYQALDIEIHNSNIYNPDFCQDMGGVEFCGSSILNLSSTQIDAVNNYWGSNEGPTTDPAGDLKGTVIQGDISYEPFLTQAYEPEIPGDPVCSSADDFETIVLTAAKEYDPSTWFNE
ncbi:hypothetical protein GF382_01025, partial [Candidatus Falkowbacteria bacterium]|nr:hypothetical protein [Candidatus Falkowbacteria bacterium]